MLPLRPSPQALTLNFSEGIEPWFSGATITGPQQELIKTRPAKRNEQDKTQLIIPLEQPLKSGAYTVDWHVVSVDGHKTKGKYTFSEINDADIRLDNSPIYSFC